MKKKTSSTSPILTIAVVALVIAGVYFVVSPQVRMSLSRVRMVKSISHSKQVKLALDSFAMDHDGRYPNAKTAIENKCPTDGSSNALFRQLFATGNTSSELIFWLPKNTVCTWRAPDDVTISKGVFDPSETLQPGDCGWAYVKDQNSVNNPSRPLLFSSPPTASGLEFDPEPLNGMVVVLRIDSSTKPMRLNAENRLMDGDGNELLTTASDVWKGNGKRPEVTQIEIAYPLKPAKR
jgi:hypothetical protein